MPAEPARSAEEISEACEVTIAYTRGQPVVPIRIRLIGRVSLWPCQLVSSSAGFTPGEIHVSSDLVTQWKFARHPDCGVVIPLNTIHILCAHSIVVLNKCPKGIFVGTVTLIVIFFVTENGKSREETVS